MSELRIVDHIIEVNPDQTMRTLLRRWGPDWDLPPRSGSWVVDSLRRAAIRVEMRDDVALVDADHFGLTLDYWLTGQDRIDAELRALDVRAVMPEKIAVAAGNDRTAPVPASIEDTLADLNEKARRELGPLPQELSIADGWVRAIAARHSGAAWHTHKGAAFRLGVSGDRYMVWTVCGSKILTDAEQLDWIEVEPNPDGRRCLRCNDHASRELAP